MEIGRRRRDVSMIETSDVSMIETSNLRDLLKQKDSDEGLESLAGLTLAAVLGCEEARRAPTRTLMDIINDEESGAAYRGLALPNQQRHNNKQQSWKSFKDRLRIRKAGVAWSASSAYPVSPTEFNLEDVRLEISPPISSSGPSNRNTVPISAINGGGDSVQPNNPAGGRGSSGGIVADSVATSAPAPNPASPTAANGTGDSVLASNPARISEEITQIMAESSNNMPASTANVGDLVPATAPIQQVRNQENSSIEVANLASEAASPASQVIRLAAALETEREEQRISRQRQEAEERGTEPAMPPPPPPMRMSLMDLLGETDRETGTRYMGGEGEEEEEEEEEGCEEGKLGCNKELGEEEEEEEEGKEEGKVEFVCCVCMVRHKDAAFIPCGHTFCRVCSKELWVSRGNCPLCNNFILEILHIF